MASETLVVTVVPGDPPHGGDSFGALPFTQSSPDIAAASADTNHPGKSPSFPRARTHGFPSPSRQRSVRSDSHQSSLGAVSDENGWAGRGDDDDDDDDEEVDGATKQPRGRFTKNPKYAKLRKNVVFVLDYAIVQLFLFAVLLVALFLTDVVAFISAPDDVDKPVELVMFLTLIVFTIELIANCTCREAYVGSFYFYMDILGTFSIVADIPTLSKGWLPDGAEIGTTLRVSRAAKIGARVSKDGVRLVIFFRSIGAMRLLRPWSLFSHRKTTRGGEKQNGSGINARRVGSTGKIAQNLDESMSKSVAIVVLLTILAAPLLLWDDSDTIPKAYHSSLSAVSAGYSDDTSAFFRKDVGDTVAAGYYDFFKSSERKPVSLAFAGNVWQWLDEYPRSLRSSDRLVVTSGNCDDVNLVRSETSDEVSNSTEGTAATAAATTTTATSTTNSSPCVALELDIALVNKWTAFLNIGMVVFVICELVLVSLLLNYSTTKLVVTPLERIFANIKKNMDQLFVSFEGKDGTPGDSNGKSSSNNNSDDHTSGDGLDAMEAAINKMARLVRHVAGSGPQGAHMLNEYVGDKNVDESTRAWLMDMNAEGKKTPKKTPEKGGEGREHEKSPPRSHNARAGTLGTVLSGRASPSPSKRMTIFGGLNAGNSKRGSLSLSASLLDCTKTPEKPPGTPLQKVRSPYRSLTKQLDAVAAAGEGEDLFHAGGDVSANGTIHGATGDEKLLVNEGDAFVSTATLSVSNRSVSFGDNSSKRTSVCDDVFDPNDPTFDEDSGDDDFFDGNGQPLRAGPELQLRQARARSRARAQGAVAAVLSARNAGVTDLPDCLDHKIIDTWDFDVLSMTSTEARAHVLMMFGSLGLLRDNDDDVDRAACALNSLDSETASTDGFCDAKTVCAFLERVQSGYRKNAYHCFEHAVDVAHTVYRYVVLTEPRTHVTQVEKFALMIAALSHDLDHPGVNNAFLVNTRDPLATVYNDSSVLENAHVACLYNLINTRQKRETGNSAETGIGDNPKAPRLVDTANVFALLDDDLYRDVRATIIACVLHTDMSHHFKMVSQMEVFHELHSEGIKANTRRVKRGIMVDCIYQKEDDRRFILCVLLHAADIGNPVKPLATYNKWTDRVLSEFFTQGDLEQKFGLPKSPMMDPAATNKPMSQINFIEFVVAPLYANFSKLFPESGELVGHLLENRVYFQTVLELELDGEAGGVGSQSENQNAEDNGDPNFAASGGARAARAGAGKTFGEKENDKAATRNRFRGLVEKHEFAKLGDCFDQVARQPTFRALMAAGHANLSGNASALPPLPRFVPGERGLHTTTSESRKNLLAVAAQGVRDVAIAAGASGKKMRGKSRAEVKRAA